MGATATVRTQQGSGQGTISGREKSVGYLAAWNEMLRDLVVR